jgi:hypothetical protein
MHIPVSMQPVGAQRAFFDKHLKTHDWTFTRKYLCPKLFFERCSKIKGEVHQVPFFERC